MHDLKIDKEWCFTNPSYIKVCTVMSVLIFRSPYLHYAPMYLQVAPSLTNCFPISGPGNHLYVFVVHDAETGNVHLGFPLGFPDENYSHTALGILTRNPLPHLKVCKSVVFLNLCTKPGIQVQ